MKKIFVLFIVLILNCNEVFASENFFNEDWWKTATVEDVEAEIANGADVKAKDEKGWTPLMYAVSNASLPVSRFAEILLKAGADINAQNNVGATALDLMKIRIMLDNGDIKPINNIFMESGWWEQATLKDVEEEIAKGIDVNAKDEEGWTPLILAVQNNNNEQIIKALIDAGADVNAKKNDDVTALMMAAMFTNNPKIVKILIDAGANVYAKIETGELAGATALDLVEGRRPAEITELLYGNFLDVNWWKTATLADVEKEITNGAKVNAKNKNGWTALMGASEFSSNPDIIKTLINAGANVNAVGKAGMTPLILAVQDNTNAEIIEVLINSGADVNAKWGNYQTVLITAASQNTNPEIIKLLVEAGADVKAKGPMNMTALDAARRFNKNYEVIETLQKYQNFGEFNAMFADCYSVQNIGSYSSNFCKCAINAALQKLNNNDAQQAQDAFNTGRVGTFKNLIQKGKSAAFNECY